MAGQMVTIDGNEAAAYIAHKTNEVVSIYPITPSSGMGELCDEWSAKGYTNIWGAIPNVIEMQSEGGAAGSVHGALQAGSLTTTFTASQGLLLMIPNMYKIAGELTPTVFHVAARSIAAQALSIFGDHSDVMAARTTGWAMLFSGSVQEAMDLALISQAATLETRIPFLHAFDGFRTSHEVMKIERVSDDVIRKMINSHFVRSLRKRALSPDHPVIRGTAQNPDAFFQARETVNPYYDSAPFVVQNTMDRFAELTGRQYRLFDYVGAEDADRVIVMMGSGAEAAEETVNYLIEEGEKVGVLKIRLFRPFAVNLFINSLPETVRSIAVLDRTKEPGAIGEPLYQDVVTAISESMLGNKQRFETPPIVVGGRYGLSSKEFTPAMVAAIFNTLNKKRIKNHFTIGIHDDVTKTSIPFDPSFSVEDPETVKGIFWGLGSDGTVGANKNSIKIIGEGTDNFAQGYFVYDSKKAGAITVSHLRFGPKPIKSTYLVSEANFVGVHQFQFLDKYNVLEQAAHGACFILNSPYPVDEIWDNIPRNLQNEIISKKIRFYIINAYDVAQKAGMGARINTIMQTCFFALSGVLPRVEVIDRIKKSIKKTYSKKGKALVEKNYAAVDATLANLAEVKIPKFVSSTIELKSLIPDFAPKFVQNVTGVLMSGRGNDLPVSAFPDDGTYPTGTAKWEKRAVSTDVPVWKSETCIQCGKCILVCPHACLRAKTYSPNRLDKAPTTFKSADAQWKELGDAKYTIQLSIDDCTGCELCVEICPVKDKQQPETKAINMKKAESYRASERDNWDFFTMLPDYTPYSTDLKFDNVRNIQLLKPLFEFSGACAGCGETPYLKLMSQLFGDRSIIANATGCSSIYGGNLPTTPWTKNDEGRGPAWSNSLFEDNAEFGLGMRLAVNQQNEYAKKLLNRLLEKISENGASNLSEIVEATINANQSTSTEIAAQRDRVTFLKDSISEFDESIAQDFLSVADSLVSRSIWIVGGDGWAYDIGFGGLDHVIATGRNLNLLVLDTEVYSNTGGQASKSTPLGAIAKFAASGKPTYKKDLGKIAMSYGNVYVASVSLGANDTHTVRTFLEAEAYDGPSLIIAYSPCIAHGINMNEAVSQQNLAVDSGYWPLYRYNPDALDSKKGPLQVDYRKPKVHVRKFLERESRFRLMLDENAGSAGALVDMAQNAALSKWKQLTKMASEFAKAGSEEKEVY